MYLYSLFGKSHSTVQKFKEINLIASFIVSHPPDIHSQMCQDLYSVFIATLGNSEKLETT